MPTFKPANSSASADFHLYRKLLKKIHSPPRLSISTLMKNDPLLLPFKAELYRQSFDTINTLCTEEGFFFLPARP